MPIDEYSQVLGKRNYRDAVSFQTKPSVPASSWGNDEFDSAKPLAANKAHTRTRHTYSQANVAATTETRSLGIVHGAGTIAAFYVGNSARAAGAATTTVNLRKNGVSVLSAVVTLNNATPAAGAGYASVQGAIDPAQATVAKGDILDVVITATAGGGTLPTEVSCTAVVDEHPTT